MQLTKKQLATINKMVNDDDSNNYKTYLNGIIETLSALGYSLKGIE